MTKQTSFEKIRDSLRKEDADFCEQFLEDLFKAVPDVAMKTWQRGEDHYSIALMHCIRKARFRPKPGRHRRATFKDSGGVSFVTQNSCYAMLWDLAEHCLRNREIKLDHGLDPRWPQSLFEAEAERVFPTRVRKNAKMTYNAESKQNPTWGQW